MRLPTHDCPNPLLQVLAITTGLSICSFMAVFFTVLLLAPLLPMAKGLSIAQLETMAALAGVLAIARSPASAVRGGPPQPCTVSRGRPASTPTCHAADACLAVLLRLPVCGGLHAASEFAP